MINWLRLLCIVAMVGAWYGCADLSKHQVQCKASNLLQVDAAHKMLENDLGMGSNALTVEDLELRFEAKKERIFAQVLQENGNAHGPDLFHLKLERPDNKLSMVKLVIESQDLTDCARLLDLFTEKLLADEMEFRQKVFQDQLDVINSNLDLAKTRLTVLEKEMFAKHADPLEYPALKTSFKAAQMEFQLLLEKKVELDLAKAGLTPDIMVVEKANIAKGVGTD